MREELKKLCVGCELCLKSCDLLSEIGQVPSLLAVRELSAEEAFGCSLCGLCEAVCPKGLAPWQLFAQRRAEAAASGEINAADWRWLLPDQKKNVMQVYRDVYQPEGLKESVFSEAEVVFFPGCTMLTYAPQLTKRVYQLLATQQGCQGIWADCCGKPLEQFGLVERKQKMEDKLIAFAQKHGVRTVITACPNCYYTMQPLAAKAGVEIRTLYEMLTFLPREKGSLAQSCTVHDSCPDRKTGIFARQVREALEKSGYTLREMQHTGKQTLCCGSGGQLSHFRPDRTEKLVGQRLQEAADCGADLLAGYCLSCVLKFDGTAKLPVFHVLELLLGQTEKEPEYKAAKARAKALFDGDAGEKRWNEIMDEDG